MKKTLAILLSLALVVCMIPAASGVAFADQTQVVYTVTVDDYTYNGNTPTLTVKEGKTTLDVSSGYEIKYYIGSTATETALSQPPTVAGTYTVTVSKTDNGTTKTGQDTFTIAKYDLSKVRISIDDQVASKTTGTSLDLSTTYFPEGTVHYYINSKEASSTEAAFLASKIKVSLTGNDTLYTATFAVAEGETNNFTGTIPATNFKKVKDISTATVKDNAGNTLTDNTFNTGEYTGKDKSIESYIKVYDGDTLLKYDTDYTFVCTDKKNVGNKTVTLKGKGNYGGTKSLTMQITARDSKYITWDSIPNQSVATISSIEPVLRDNNLGLTLKKGTDYDILSTSGAPGTTGTIVVKLKENYGNAEISKTYNVVTDAYNVENMTVYYNGYDTASHPVSKTGVTFSGYSQALSGITVYSSYPGNVLSSSNYDVTYEYTKDEKKISTTTPKDAATYTVYVVGKGNYAGKKQIGTYTISKYDMSKASVSVSVTSAAVAPAVTVKTTGGYAFTKDTDYTVYSSASYDKKNVYVTITGKGSNLTGTFYKSYAVNPKSISSCAVTLSKDSTPYTGYTVTPTVTVKDGNTTLLQGVQYYVTYKDSTGKTVTSIKDTGTYTVVVTGDGGYTGSTSKTFTVTGNSISSYTVTLDKNSYTADGKYITLPKVTKVASGASVLSASDYKVTYQNASGTTVTAVKAPGNYKVVVTGAGKYTGTTYATFTVTGKTNTITGVKSSYKIYVDSDQLELYPTATKGKITYESSDPSVASVSSSGTITPVKAGRAKITITAAGDDLYESATISTVIKVYPTKATLHQKPWTAGKGKAKVRWDKQDEEGVTYYQIRYSRDKKFSSGTYKTVTRIAAQNDYDTQSTTIKNLKSGSRYYFKVRAVKEVKNDYGKTLTYYGKWSNWKSVKVQ